MRTLVPSGRIESPTAPADRQPAHMRKPSIAPPSKEYIERKFPHLRVLGVDSFV